MPPIKTVFSSKRRGENMGKGTCGLFIAACVGVFAGALIYEILGDADIIGSVTKMFSNGADDDDILPDDVVGEKQA